MKTIFLTLSLLALLPQPPRAEDFGLDRLGASAFAEAGQGVPVPLEAVAAEDRAAAPAAPAAAKDWTVMVFLNAKNDLERFGLQDMNEMETVGSSGRVNVVVQMGRMAGYDSSDGNWTGVRRYYVTKDSDNTRIASRVVQDMGRLNMGDADELRKFIVWAKRQYPARRYALVVWNHGNGWLRGNPADYEGASKGISFDDETGNNIDTPQLRRALADAGGVDILASDACLMQMAEVAYEVRRAARFMVGSEETEPGAGYNYSRLLSPLVREPGMGAEAFGRVIVDAYWLGNLIGRGVATHSLLDLSKAGNLATRMDAFARAAMASTDKAVLRQARADAQKYAIDDNKDLRHFASLVQDRASSRALKSAAAALVNQIDGELVLLNRSSILPRSNSNGIAVYLPAGRVNGNFAALALAADTQWDEFLAWLNR